MAERFGRVIVGCDTSQQAELAGRGARRKRVDERVIRKVAE